MRKDIASFAAGIIVGAVLGALIRDEDKKRFQQALNKQADKLRKEYEGPVKDGVDKVKQFVKEHLS
ncbi:MAG: hypothetical protein AAF963_00675 [Bacteroidota bacterium]